MATKTSTNIRRKTTAARRSSSPRSKKKMQPRTMPVWLRNLLAVCIILVFSTGFYWFFIRPYAYRWKPCYGQKGYGVCMPCNYEVHGIDISHYQGKIDWELLTHNREAQFPIHFIFLKATEGGDHGDDTFTQNFGQARKYGFIRGAYHYFIPKTDARKPISLSVPCSWQRETCLPYLMWRLPASSHRRNLKRQSRLGWIG